MVRPPKLWQWLVVLSVPVIALFLSGCPWAGEVDYATGATPLTGVLTGVGAWGQIPTWLSATGSPLVAAREQHSMIWTTPGIPRFMIWGGRGTGGYLSSGATWNQRTRVWSSMPSVTIGGAVTGGYARVGHTAVWTGSEMVLFAGSSSSGSTLNSILRYDPAGNTWLNSNPGGNVYGRIGHTAIWNGSRMLVFGGWGSATYSWSYWWWSYSYSSTPTYLGTIQAYNPTLNTWTDGSTSGEPAPRWYHSSVWTGTEMIIWGGSNQTYLNNGKKYDPSADSWTDVGLTNTPAGREGHTAVFTGVGTNPWNNKMVVWGGGNPRAMNSGGVYDITLDLWTSTRQDDTTPISRTNHTALWMDPVVTGVSPRMIVWGGTDMDGNILNSGGLYDVLTNTWQTVQLNSAPGARRGHTAVWNGTQMVVFGGFNGEEYLNDAFLYTPPNR